MKPAVVVLNDFCHVQGGASKVAIDEAIALAQAGLDVTFLGAVGPPAAELNDSPVNVECLDQPELGSAARHPGVMVQALWNRKAALHAREIFRRLPPRETVVHLHGYTKALTTSPIRLAARLGLPIVCTLHDFFAACPNGAFFDYRAEKPCTRRALSAACIARDCDKRHYSHKLYRVARGVVQRRVGEFPRVIRNFIALSDRSARMMAPYLPPDAQIHCVPNRIDAVHSAAVDPAENRLLLYVGRLDREKGVEFLAQVASRVGQPLLFVGDGPLRAQLEAIPGVSVMGWVPRETVRQHLAHARCLVFPSLWYETYGLVVAEAAAIGVPAIVSDISAAAERVADGVTGWHFRSGDPADLARCLRLIEDDDTVREAGAAAYRSHWAAAATAQEHAEILIDIYRSALREQVKPHMPGIAPSTV
jgi:glycosyltransferase involved in cell wall biosynthesis